MQTVQDTVRYLRILHLTLLVSIVLYALVAETLTAFHLYSPSIFVGFLVAAGAQIGAVLLLRSRMVNAAADALRTRPEDTAELNRWRTGHIVSFTLCESIGLFGLVLRVLGGPLKEVVPFYGAAFFLLLLLFPRDPAIQ